jgi:hypothetical protein
MDGGLKMQNRHESGSALWFILLGIALLAALAITITRTSGTAEQSGDVEHAKINASSLIRYASGIDEAIEQMRMRGVSENDIDFETTALPGYTNPICTTTACQVFNVGGGGMTYTKAPAEATALDWIFTGANQVANVGTDSPELVMILPDIDEGICQEIDNEAGVTVIPKETGKIDITTKFVGVYPTAGSALTIDLPAGVKTACFQGNQDSSGTDLSGKYYFYHTLLAR